MRIASAIFAGSMAALAVLAAPALAKNANAPKPEEQAASAGCTSYEQAPSGEWKPVPCQEGSGTQTQHKPATTSSSDATH